jgi:acyl carrier protein
METTAIKDIINGLLTQMHPTLSMDDVKPEDNLQTDLGFDSLDKEELLMDLESRFDINIHDNEFEGVQTVQQLYDLVIKLS